MNVLLLNDFFMGGDYHKGNDTSIGWFIPLLGIAGMIIIAIALTCL